ncbi:MAG: hypothetical protein M1814_004808 [Vezdaea aestivalis]|nr:MAG: hypothetical protein M1814_004808 [Vezdaea aestivalis]
MPPRRQTRASRIIDEDEEMEDAPSYEAMLPEEDNETDFTAPNPSQTKSPAQPERTSGLAAQATPLQAPATRATGKTLRAKPKIVRRTAEERERSEREELQRIQARATAESGPAKDAASTASTRGRGKALQQSTSTRSALDPRKLSSALPAGPFGMGSAAVQPPKRAARGAADGGGAKGVSSGGREGGEGSGATSAPRPGKDSAPPKSKDNKSVSPKASRKKQVIKKEPTVAQSATAPESEDLERPRVNVQHISLLSSDSESDSPPIRPGRSRKARDSDAKRPARNIEANRRASLKRSPTALRSLRPICVERHEHTEQNTPINTTASASTGPSARLSPTTKRQSSSPTSHRRSVPPVKPEPSIPPKPRSRRGLPLPLHVSTPEHRLEYSHMSETRVALSHDLDRPSLQEGSSDSEVEKAPLKFGAPYLFQFPPLLPDLWDPLAPPVQADPVPNTNAGNDADAELAEGGEAGAEPSDSKPKPKPGPVKNPPGLAGVLTLHESGRLRLGWGGVVADVSRGTGSESLFDAVVGVWDQDRAEGEVESKELEKKRRKSGRVVSLGGVKERLLVEIDYFGGV